MKRKLLSFLLIGMCSLNLIACKKDEKIEEPIEKTVEVSSSSIEEVVSSSSEEVVEEEKIEEIETKEVYEKEPPNLKLLQDPSYKKTMHICDNNGIYTFIHPSWVDEEASKTIMANSYGDILEIFSDGSKYISYSCVHDENSEWLTENSFKNVFRSLILMTKSLESSMNNDRQTFLPEESITDVELDSLIDRVFPKPEPIVSKDVYIQLDDEKIYAKEYISYFDVMEGLKYFYEEDGGQMTMPSKKLMAPISIVYTFRLNDNEFLVVSPYMENNEIEKIMNFDAENIDNLTNMDDANLEKYGAKLEELKEKLETQMNEFVKDNMEYVLYGDYSDYIVN